MRTPPSDCPLPQPKPGLCTPAALCRPASPVWGKGHFSQCVSDQTCAAYGTNDWSRPPNRFCCDELAQMAAFYCDGTDPAKVTAWSSGYNGKPCAARPDCVVQGFNSSVPILLPPPPATAPPTTPAPTTSGNKTAIPSSASPAAAASVASVAAAAMAAVAAAWSA